jgi:Zinc dependent phospholipase C
LTARRLPEGTALAASREVRIRTVSCARRPLRVVAGLATAAALLALVPGRAHAYSVLAHESTVDAVWDLQIRGLLLQRFPRSSRQEIDGARAFAYGGSVIQDLGYYPFGSRFFSDLLHYVKTGDFVETMIRDAQDVNEYAFALGALAHYAADNTGHPEAVNRAVPLIYPKLRKKYGDSVTYAQSPTSHIIVEFSFDVVQAAAGGYVPEAYHTFIGFQVAKPLLERAFRETYAIDMQDVFGDSELAIATYRFAVSQLLPEITATAWKTKEQEIRKLVPNVDRNAFIFRYPRKQFEKEFGRKYRRPGFLARILTFVYRLLPKIGPLRPLSFQAPTPEAEKLFTASLVDTRARYAQALEDVRLGRLQLANTNFDTGRLARPGEYALADKTISKLARVVRKRDLRSIQGDRSTGDRDR